MTENDDQLIAQFFEENRQDVEDKGFSEQVMRHLPESRVYKYNRIWTILCTAIGVAFFLLVDGVDTVRNILRDVLGDVIGYAASIDLSGLSPMMIVLSLITIAFVGLYNLVISE